MKQLIKQQLKKTINKENKLQNLSRSILNCIRKRMKCMMKINPTKILGDPRKIKKKNALNAEKTLI